MPFIGSSDYGAIHCPERCPLTGRQVAARGDLRPNRTAKKILAALFFMICVSSTARAGLCPMCRQALEQANQNGLIRGFYLSILLIAGVPVLIFLILGLYFLHRHTLKNEK